MGYAVTRNIDVFPQSFAFSLAPTALQHAVTKTTIELVLNGEALVVRKRPNLECTSREPPHQSEILSEAYVKH
uniref:Uncharacterized protein n=1 Tax=Ralstonia syzygii R24 TaxID=907261 RepID=G3AA04_9RALS|nr:hypothetical protein RALSY_mp10679 [Ralstonia syzygii R24]